MKWMIKSPVSCRRRASGLMGLAASVIAVVGFVAGTNPATAQDQIRFGNGKFLAHTPGLFADEDNQFEACGINVVGKVYPSGGAATNELVDGKLEFVTTGISPAIRGMASEKLYLMAVSGLTGGGQWIAVPPDSPIKKPIDLKGKRIGMATGTGSEGVFKTTIAPAIGLKDGDYEIVDVSKIDRIQAVLDGKLDAVMVLDPEAGPALAAKKLRVLFDFGRYDIKPIVLVGQRDFVDSHPKESAAFLECYLRAMREVQNNPKHVAEVMREHVKNVFNMDLSDDVIASMVGRIVVQPTFTPDVMATLDVDAKSQLAKGTIKQMPDMSRFLRLDMLNAALPQAGWDEMRIGHGIVGAHAPLLVALAGDAFAKAGVKVDGHPFGSGAAGISASINQTMDVGDGCAQPVLQAMSSGRVIVLGMVGYAAALQRLQVAADSDIKSVKDLAGKRIAMVVGSSLEQAFVYKVLPKYGLSGDDVTIVNMRSADGRAAALKSGEIDAMLQVEFNASKYVNEGIARNLLDLSGADLQPCMIFAGVDALNRNESQIVDVLRGLVWGEDMVRTQPDKVAALLEKFYASIGISYSKEAMSATVHEMAGKEVNPVVTDDIIAYLKDQANELHAAGTLAEIPNWDTSIRNDLMEKALANRIPVTE